MICKAIEESRVTRYTHKVYAEQVVEPYAFLNAFVVESVDAVTARTSAIDKLRQTLTA